MTIFFINYWGLNDPLTIASTLPHLELLEEMKSIDKVVFFTIEREDEALDLSVLQPLSKVEHVPVRSKKFFLNTLTKLSDFKKFKKLLKEAHQKYSPEKIICRSSLAGYFGYWLWKKFKTPFYVESFEPHAEYMAEAGIWKRGRLRYNLQKKIEENIKKYASAIMPVSQKYSHQLTTEGVTAPLDVIPCSVDIGRFKYSKAIRSEWRNKLGLKDKVVGIYVGKFGGMYMDEMAFDLFSAIKKNLGDTFFLIVLTPQKEVKEQLQKRGFTEHFFFIDKVPHEEIPKFLSAADFGFSLVKKSKVTEYFSPIKNGEYWASGLPILIPENIGDDSEIIRNEGGGVVCSFEDDVEIALKKMIELINQESHRDQTSLLAKKYRSRNIGKEVYAKYYS